MGEEITTIQLRRSTRDALKRLMRKDETYDEGLRRLLDLDVGGGE